MGLLVCTSEVFGLMIPWNYTVDVVGVQKHPRHVRQKATRMGVITSRRARLQNWQQKMFRKFPVNLTSLGYFS